jgi:flagellar biosynthesis/type III secretory pathway chaperone
MEALERVTVVMALMRQLQQVMEQEILILRGMRLDRLEEVVAEKTTLCHAYEAELRALRREPELLANLDPAIRSELEHATRDFQTRAAANLRALDAARSVVERVMRHIGASLEAAPFKPRLYGNGPARASMRGEVIALAFDRQI